MNKLTKLLSVFVIAGAVGVAGMSGFAGCKAGNGGNGGNKHSHSYTWVDDGNGKCHKHCDADGECDAKDLAPQDHVDTNNDKECDNCRATLSGGENPDPENPGETTDNAIVPEYKGEAAGPVAGEQKFTAGFSAENSPAAGWTDGCVTITSGTIRNRDAVEEDGSTKIAGYTKSVQNGVFEIKLPVKGKITIEYSSGSGTVGSAKYKLTKPDGTSEDVAVNYAAKVLRTLVIEEAEAGTYKFEKSGGTIDTYNIKVEYNTTATPINSIEISDSGTTDYLVTQKVDCTGVEIIAKDDSGASHAVNLENCKFDTSKYNPNVSGEYEIGVTYYLDSNLDSETKEFKATYKVKVYMVDSIALTTVGLASSKQVTVQQAYLPNGTFSSSNLSVIATCGFGGKNIEQKLKNEWFTVSTPTLTAEGKQTVTVSVDSKYTTGNKAVSATYEVIVKAKKEVLDNKVEVTVGETGEFATLTQAVQYLKACNYEASVNKVIKLAAGTYTEKVWLDIDNVTLTGTGENIDDTVLSYSLVEGDLDAISNSVWGLNCATLHVTGNNFKAYNLAIRNDFDYMKNSGNYSGSQGPQGVALTLEGDGNVLYSCHLFGNQDTLYMKKGRTYYKDCQIDGNIDFIFGGETGLAFFEECDIVAIDREGKENTNPQNGYVTAPQHKAATKPDYGYIFYRCNLTDDGKTNAGSMALGRPWGDSATVSYMECKFSAAYSQNASNSKFTDDSGKEVAHKIHRWNDMSGNKPENADYSEYGSMDADGNPIMTEAVFGGKVLTAEQAANYTKANIFGTSNGKQAYSTVFDCDAHYANLRILVGLDDGEIPEDPTVNINLKDDTLPNGNCVSVINEKYADKLTWAGTGVFESVKPENGIKIGTDTVITVNVVGEVSLLAGYELPVSDYVITYKDGKATIKFVASTGTYGSFVGGIVIDTSKTPEDTLTVNVTVDYNDNGATTNGTIVAVVGSPLTKPADPVRDGFKFAGWKVNGADYNFTENVTQAFTLVAQWESQGDYDLTAGGSVNLNEFTTGQINGGSSATYRGVIVEVSAGQKFAPRPANGDAQVNASETAPVKIKFKVNAGTTKEQIGISFTAAAGATYIPTFTVDVEAVGDDTYAVVSITSNSYPTTMTVTIS